MYLYLYIYVDIVIGLAPNPLIAPPVRKTVFSQDLAAQGVDVHLSRVGSRFGHLRPPKQMRLEPHPATMDVHVQSANARMAKHESLPTLLLQCMGSQSLNVLEEIGPVGNVKKFECWARHGQGCS